MELLVKKPIVVDLEEPVYHMFSNPESATRKEGSDNTDAFCEATGQIYALLSKNKDSIKSAGYIFALNQLLVILVNNKKPFRDQIDVMRGLFEKNVFSEATEKVDVNQSAGLMKVVYSLMKYKMYLPLAIIIKGRRVINSLRRSKEVHR